VTQDQWYSNKQLFEMMQSLTTKMAELQLEMAQTTILIRDYNGLREKINRCEHELFESRGKEDGSKGAWGYITGGIGLTIAFIAMATK